ncbi:arylsulfatase A [Flavobacterium faecale]|uniref:Arylsulfatase A n=2 Tax=Flavobacterium faecale TaxID=1355330 RepID=A0A2S1LIW7_9FLAO|nr:arylsulfatase A [Flavobacterium faecale]
MLLLVTATTIAQKRPNIVLIMADDMGYECIGANGSTTYKTPNIDRIAAAGVRFDNCYSQPLCTPSRVKIMTGKSNFRNYEAFEYLNPNQVTFGNLLKDAGYATCIAGKWQLNGNKGDMPGNQDLNRPNHFGFGEYCLWQVNKGKSEGERFWNPLIVQNGKELPRDANAYGPDIFSNYIMDFIDRKADVPFLVYYPMALVHEPFMPTPDSPESKDPKLRNKRDPIYYKDMVAYTDKIVGKIQAKLKEKGLLENTLFIFTADNGSPGNIVSATDLGKIKGGKGKTIIHGNHVPFVASWPARMEAKRTEKGLISFADVLPSLCDAADVKANKFQSDGFSFLPLITNKDKKIQDEVFIHYTPRMNKLSQTRWVLNDTYKLYKDGRFFNTAKDPLEKEELKILSAKEEEIKAGFQKVLDKREKEIPFELNNTEFKVK